MNHRSDAPPADAGVAELLNRLIAVLANALDGEPLEAA